MHNTSNDIVISACGMLSALGIGFDEGAAAWAEQETACFPAARTPPPEGIDPLAGEVPDFRLADLLPTPKAYLDRQSELLLAAIALARGNGRLEAASFPPERAGLAIGTAWGAAHTLDLFFQDYIQKGPRLVKPILFPHSYANAAISLAAMEWEIRGPHLNFVSGDDASTHALIAALDGLRRDDADLFIAGGVEALSPVRWRSRTAGGRLTPPGEGAAVLLLERETTARARGRAPLARLSGGALGQGLPANRATTLRDTVRQALADAGLPPSAIRSCWSNAAVSIDETGLPGVPVHLPADFYGDVEGASGALQTACALFEAPASLPALILTTAPDGSSAAAAVLDA